MSFADERGQQLHPDDLQAAHDETLSEDLGAVIRTVAWESKLSEDERLRLVASLLEVSTRAGLAGGR